MERSFGGNDSSDIELHVLVPESHAEPAKVITNTTATQIANISTNILRILILLHDGRTDLHSFTELPSTPFVLTTSPAPTPSTLLSHACRHATASALNPLSAM